MGSTCLQADNASVVQQILAGFQKPTFVTLSVESLRVTGWQIAGNSFERIWDFDVAPGEYGEKCCNLFSLPSKSRFGVAWPGGKVTVHQVSDGKQTNHYITDLIKRRKEWGLVFTSDDGRWCLECNPLRTNSTALIDLKSRNVVERIGGFHVRGVTGHPEGKVFAGCTGSMSTDIELFTLANKSIDLIALQINTSARAFRPAFSWDGRWLGLAGGIPPRTLSILELTTLNTINLTSQPKTAAARLISERLYQEGWPIQDVPVEEQLPLCGDVVFSPNSDSVYCTGVNGGVEHYSLPNGELLSREHKSDGYVTSLCHLPNAPWLVSAHSGGMLRCTRTSGVPRKADRRRKPFTKALLSAIEAQQSIKIELD